MTHEEEITRGHDGDVGGAVARADVGRPGQCHQRHRIHCFVHRVPGDLVAPVRDPARRVEEAVVSRQRQVERVRPLRCRTSGREVARVVVRVPENRVAERVLRKQQRTGAIRREVRRKPAGRLSINKRDRRHLKIDVVRVDDRVGNIRVQNHQRVVVEPRHRQRRLRNHNAPDLAQRRVGVDVKEVGVIGYGQAVGSARGVAHAERRAIGRDGDRIRPDAAGRVVSLRQRTVGVDDKRRHRRAPAVVMGDKERGLIGLGSSNERKSSKQRERSTCKHGNTPFGHSTIKSGAWGYKGRVQQPVLKLVTQAEKSAGEQMPSPF